MTRISCAKKKEGNEKGRERDGGKKGRKFCCIDFSYTTANIRHCAAFVTQPSSIFFVRKDYRNQLKLTAVLIRVKVISDCDGVSRLTRDLLALFARICIYLI